MQSKESIQERLLRAHVKYLSDANDDFRLVAVESLLMSSWDPGWTPGALIDEGGLTPLVACLSDDIDLIRGAAARLLGRIIEGGEFDMTMEAGAEKGLKKMLDDEDPMNRRYAGNVLDLIKEKKCE